jgi:hypothetical protein
MKTELNASDLALIEADAVALYEGTAEDLAVSASWRDAPEFVRALCRLAVRDPAGLARQFGRPE